MTWQEDPYPKWQEEELKAYDICVGDYLKTPNGIFQTLAIERHKHIYKFRFPEGPPLCKEALARVTLCIPTPDTNTEQEPGNMSHNLFKIKNAPLRLWRVEIESSEGKTTQAGIAIARTQGGALAQLPKALKEHFPTRVVPMTKAPATSRRGASILPHIEDLLLVTSPQEALEAALTSPPTRAERDDYIDSLS